MTHREQIITLAHKAQDTPTAQALFDYHGLLVLLGMVAGPGGHEDEAIDLVTNRRDEAHVIARRQFELLTAGQRDEIEKRNTLVVIHAFCVAADMLVRTQKLLRSEDPYDIPAAVVAVAGASLLTSGLVRDAERLIVDEDADAG